MTKTTLRELSHKYASVLRKCAILNAMVFGITAVSPAQADYNFNPYEENYTFNSEVHFSPDTYHQIGSATILNGAKLIGDEPNENNGWGDFGGFYASSLDVSGNVSLTNVNATVSTEPVTWDGILDGNDAPVFSLTSPGYAKNDYVTWGGKLYQQTNNDGYAPSFYESLQEGEELTSLENVVLSKAKLFTLGQEYKANDVILVVDTKDNLNAAGLTTKTGDALMVMAFTVNNGFNTSVENVLNADNGWTEISTSSPERSLTINGAKISMSMSNLAGEGGIFSEHEDEIYQALIALTDDPEKIRSIDQMVGRQIANYDVDILGGSEVDVGNGSRIGKETTGTLTISGSTLTAWGEEGDISESNDPLTSIDHLGQNGDMAIKEGSTINLYGNSVLIRGAATDGDEMFAESTNGSSNGDIVLSGNSKINMYGSTEATSYDALDSETHTINPGEAIVHVNQAVGNLKLTDGSSLNVYGDDNSIQLRNAGSTEDLSATALYVEGSKVNIGTENNSTANLTLYHYEEGKDGVEGGTIALNVGGEVNLYGTLTADITSITQPETVNLYNGGQLNGKVFSTNVFAKNKTTHTGTLSLVDSFLYLGKNTLEANTLALKNSTILTTIGSDIAGGDYGKMVLQNLTADDVKEDVKVSVMLENNLQKAGDSVTIDFLNQGFGLEGGEDGNFSDPDGIYTFTYDDGKLTLTRNDKSEETKIDDLNNALASAWAQGNFAEGSNAAKMAQYLQTLHGPALSNALKQLKPTDPKVGTQIAGQIGNQIVGIVLGPKGPAPAKPGKGPAGPGPKPGPHGPRNRSGGDTFTNAGVWAQGLYNYAKLDGSNGYTGKTKGVALGVDGIIGDNLKLGIAYAYTTTDVDADASNTDVDTHTGVLYGEYVLGNAFVNAATTYSYSKYDNSNALVSSNYNMDSVYGQLMTGYNFDLTNVTLTPETGLRYLWTKTHSYTDTADQRIDAHTSNTWTGVLGGRASMAFATEKATFTPELKLAATYDLHRGNGSSSVHLANGSSYVVEGEALKRFGIETGAKIGMTIDNMDFSLSYEGRFKKDYQDHTGMVNFRYNF